jgi:WD40 repeat protein
MKSIQADMIRVSSRLVFSVLACFNALSLYGQVIDRSIEIGDGHTLSISQIAELKKQTGLAYRKGCSPACYAMDDYAGFPFRGGIQLWNVLDGSSTILRSGNSQTYTSIAFSQDAKVVAAAGNGEVLVWEAASHSVISKLRAKPYQDNISLNKNGQAMFFYEPPSYLGGLVSSFGQSLLFYPIEAVKGGNLPPEIDPDRYPHRFEYLGPGGGRFSPVEPDLLAVHYRVRIYLWNVRTKTIVRKFIDNGFAQTADPEFAHGNIDDIQFSRDGLFLLSTGAGHVRVWEVATGRLIRDFTIGGRWSGLTTFSLDNKYIATTNSDGVTNIGEIATGKIVWRGGKDNYRPHFSDSRISLISLDNGDIFNFRTGKEVEGLKGEFLANGDLLLKSVGTDYSVWRITEID